ncbi:70 kDa peptidyl-prolyl isomerase-like [Ceratina calcarata]|uniref:70 kDa peptidyl-prolyl isomerase-like n=1 Tax=Ceratina calcarata TaxID=156304 RepID=A0AAJ7IVH9_9HYME|nr:70 kDa peptidyl-prolyl isomerase-like [Ceratina calcarata]
MLLLTWESADKVVRKDIIKPGIFSKTATECARCNIIIENIEVDNRSTQDKNEKLNSNVLDGLNEKSLIIGEADNEIDRQIERALQMMLVLEKSLITIRVPSEDIDKHSIIKAQITMNHIEPHKPIWEWTPEEKYQIASRYKETGVQLFKEQRWVDAFYRFSKACKILITLEPIADLELDKKLENDINNLRLQLYNNMAGCHLKRKNYEYTVSLCTKVLDKEINNVKALYRRGVAYGNLKNIERAFLDLRNAFNLEPHNPTIKQQYLIYDAKCQEANKKCDDMIRRMFKA